MVAVIVIAALLAVMIAALSLPVDVGVSVNVDRRAKWVVRLSGFGGLGYWEFKRKARTDATGTPSEEKERSRDGWRMWDAARVRGLWDSVWKLLVRLKGQVKFRRVDSDLSVCLGDDYYTGMLSAVLAPITVFASTVVRGDIKVTPVFEEEPALVGFLSVDLRLRPIGLVAPCLAFVSSQPVREAGRILSRRE